MRLTCQLLTSLTLPSNWEKSNHPHLSPYLSVCLFPSQPIYITFFYTYDDTRPIPVLRVPACTSFFASPSFPTNLSLIIASCQSNSLSPFRGYLDFLSSFSSLSSTPFSYTFFYPFFLYPSFTIYFFCSLFLVFLASLLFVSPSSSGSTMFLSVFSFTSCSSFYLVCTH